MLPRLTKLSKNGNILKHRIVCHKYITLFKTMEKEPSSAEVRP